MKRIFKKNKINTLRIIKENNLQSLPRMILSCIIVISIFYSMPIIINFTNNKIESSAGIENNSKAILAYTLNNQSKNPTNSTKLNEEDLLIDIYSLNDQETDTVRLDASTIKQLFEETDYKLDDVRRNKLVKPIALTLLPAEIKMIENVKKRKEFFIQIVLPLILEENKKINLDRRRLFNIINKSNNSKLEKNWLNKKYKQYGIPSKDLLILKRRMDIVPVSLAIAQAAKETGWGTSRFAQQGNALFGQWTWSGDGLKPKEADKNE